MPAIEIVSKHAKLGEASMSASGKSIHGAEGTNVAQQVNNSKALELRKRGWSYKKIAIALGCDQSEALRLVQQALEEIPPDTVQMLVKLELLRLNDMMSRMHAKAVAGSRSAIDGCLRILGGG